MSEPADAVMRSATRAALLRLVPPSVFQASVVGIGSGESSAGTGTACTLVTYSLAGRSGVLRLSGSPPVVRKESDWRPASRALRVVLCATGIAALAAWAVRHAYSSQHEWFAQYGHDGVIGALGLIGAIVMARGVYETLLPREAWDARTLWIPSLAAVGFAVAASIACHLAGPSSADALSRLRLGDRAAALMEARALASGIDVPGGHSVLDTLHLEQARTARTVEEIAAPLHETWYDPAARAAAMALLDGHIQSDAATAYAAHDAAALDKIADVANAFETGRGAVPHVLANLARARTCGENSDWECATSQIGAASGAPATELTATRDAVTESAGHELERLYKTAAPPGDIRAQRDRMAAMLAAAKCITDLTGQPTQPSAASLKASLAPLQQQVTQLDKREAAAAEAKRRQEEALEKQRQAQEAATQRAREAQEHEASRVVLCSDGSYSGCLCHADSHQGCCSHHGGIAGCAP